MQAQMQLLHESLIAYIYWCSLDVQIKCTFMGSPILTLWAVLDETDKFQKPQNVHGTAATATFLAL